MRGRRPKVTDVARRPPRLGRGPTAGRHVLDRDGKQLRVDKAHGLPPTDIVARCPPLGPAGARHRRSPERAGVDTIESTGRPRSTSSTRPKAWESSAAKTRETGPARCFEQRPFRARGRAGQRVAFSPASTRWWDWREECGCTREDGTNSVPAAEGPESVHERRRRAMVAAAPATSRVPLEDKSGASSRPRAAGLVHMHLRKAPSPATCGGSTLRSNRGGSHWHGAEKCRRGPPTLPQYGAGGPGSSGCPATGLARLHGGTLYR